MRKAILLTLVLLLAFSATGFCFVPDPVIEKGKVTLGYSLHSLDRNSNIDGNLGKNWNMNEFYSVYGLEKNLAAYVSFASLEKAAINSLSENINHQDKITDYGLQYALNSKFALILGSKTVNVKETEVATGIEAASEKITKMTYGATFRHDISRNLDSYFTWMKNPKVEDYVLGTVYKLDNNTYIDVHYKHLKATSNEGDSTTTMKGLGAGVSVKF